MNFSENRILAFLLSFAVCVATATCGEKNKESAPQSAADGSAGDTSRAVDETQEAKPRAIGFENGKPVVSQGTLFFPKFVLRNGETAGGMMFAATTPQSNRAILLSAMHLLGPSTGMEKQLTVAEISENWSSVVATELVKGKRRQFSGIGLGIPGASAEVEASQSGDVIAFIPEEVKKLNPISISDSVPKAGDDLWLLSPNIANDSHVHRAVAVEVIYEGFLVYEFENRIVISGTSGAPVVNRQGLVVAVHRGGGTHEGKTMGVGTLARRFLPSLDRELQAKSR